MRSGIRDRLLPFLYPELRLGTNWYTPDHTDANFEYGDSNAPWEGIGTGWFHSVLGGGYDTRPLSYRRRKTQ